MNWAGINARLTSIQKQLDANQLEKDKLKEEYERVQDYVGCTHNAQHQYVVADFYPQHGCRECDRLETERGRGSGSD